VKTRLLGRSGLVRKEGVIEIRPRLFERQEHAGRLARTRIADMSVFVGHLGHVIIALGVGQELGGHPHRPARVEHVDHRAVIGRVDLERGVHLGRGRPADQQRHGHAGALHFLGHRHHLVEAGGDEAGQPDHVGLVVVRAGKDRRPGHHDAQIDHVIAIALEHHADDVLADVVHIALHCRHDDLALGLAVFFGEQVLFRLDEGDEVGNRLLHHPRGFHHLRQEHLAAAEQVADHVHAVHQGAFDDLDRPPALLCDGGAHDLGIIDDMRVDALDQRVFKPLFDGPAAPLLSGLLIGDILALEAFSKRNQAFRRVRIAVEDHVLAGLAQGRVDLVVDVQLPGVDNRHVKPGGDGVVQEHRMHRAAHRLVAAEGETEVREPP